MKEDNIDYGALLYAEEDKYIRNEIHNGTPETRKNWGIEDWKYGISCFPDLISEKDFKAKYAQLVKAKGFLREL